MELKDWRGDLAFLHRVGALSTVQEKEDECPEQEGTASWSKEKGRLR